VGGRICCDGPLTGGDHLLDAEALEFALQKKQTGNQQGVNALKAVAVPLPRRVGPGQ